jgi:hypothetical protein
MKKQTVPGLLPTLDKLFNQKHVSLSRKVVNYAKGFVAAGLNEKSNYISRWFPQNFWVS